MRILVGKKHPLAQTSRRTRELGRGIRAKFVTEEQIFHQAQVEAVAAVVLDFVSQPFDNATASASIERTRTLVLCLHPVSEPLGSQAIVATACAFFLDTPTAEDVTHVLASAHPQLCVRASLPRSRGAAATAAAHSTLSARDKVILALLAQEKTSKEIAGVLGLSARTVDAQRSALMRRLGVQSSVGLACYAVSTGLLGP